MNFIIELWHNKNNPRGRIDITFFFINLFLLICHVILMGLYIIIGHKCMICVNIVSIIIYISQINSCFKKPKVYVPLTFFEIWFHMIFAVLAFGWTPGFQNWSFALIAAYFLPVYSMDNDKMTKLQSIIFTTIIILTYFVISVLIHIVNIPIAVELDDIMCRILFTLNNLFAFISITLFAIFYTNTSKRKEFELTRKADYDELTELYNRHAILQVSERIQNDIISSREKYNAAIIDIDYFKKVNDSYGHNSGDIVLKELAAILKNYNDDLIPARWGGEEFIILSTVDVSYTEFKKLMEKLRIKISEKKFKIENKKEINITISIGTTKVKKDQRLNDALKIADSNLYKAKENGRNMVVG